MCTFWQSDIVPFDRFYLGGPDTLRGFDYREVGNRDDDDPNESVGGNSYALVSLGMVSELRSLWG